MARKFGYCSRFSGFLGLRKDNLVVLYRGRCKQWKCPECSQMLRSKWRSHLALKINEIGGSWCFITITAPAYGKQPFLSQLELSARLFKKEFNNVMTFIRKRWGTHAYVRVLEIQKRGAIHAHILMNFHPKEDEVNTIRSGKNKGRKYIPVLKSYVQSRGFGHQCDVEILTGSPLQVATYITKYITKESRQGEAWLPSGTRYIQCSQAIGALNKHESGEDDWTQYPNKLLYMMIEHKIEFWDGDKDSYIDYKDLDDNGEYH